MAAALDQTVLVVCPASSVHTAACFKQAGCSVTSCDSFELAVSLLKHQPFDLVIAEAHCDTASEWTMLDAARHTPLSVVCSGALPSWLASPAHAEKAGIIDMFLSPPDDPAAVEQLLTRLRTGTLHTNLRAYLEARMGITASILASSDSDETAHGLLLPTEYSRQGSVTQEAWDVSCDNLQVLLVDEAGASTVAGDGELLSHDTPHHQKAPTCGGDAPQRTDTSVVGSKRDLESCLTSEPAAKRPFKTRTSMRTKRPSERAREAGLAPTTPPKLPVVTPMWVPPAPGMVPLHRPSVADVEARTKLAVETAIATMLDQHRSGSGMRAPLGLSLDIKSVLGELA